ncbi:MAG: hypothetical protein FWD73_15705 [Polyangiaceae bacterium]|nr:hypothetical protein [Polyangiaceae bacterium]
MNSTVQKTKPRSGNHGASNTPNKLNERVEEDSTTKRSDRGSKKNANGSNDNEKPRRADLLVAQAREAAELFHNEDGVAYATVKSGPQRLTMPVRSRRFRQWLTSIAFAATGRGIGSSTADEVLATLEAYAVHVGSQETVHIRTAMHDGAIWIDLGDESGKAVHATAEGWTVTQDVVPRFVRPSAQRPLSHPARGGSVQELRPFLNVADDHGFVLSVAWIIAALRPGLPFPIAVFSGEQGTGKSTASRVLRMFVDPNKSPVRAPPKDDETIFVSAHNAHVLAFDNLSGVPTWMSDAMCRLATGSGFAKRGLYTDGEEHVFSATRPIIINGIDDMTTRADLAERALLIELTPIDEKRRREESVFFGALNASAPRIFGALLDGIVGALARGKVKFDRLPRMADFVTWATAAEQALGFSDGAVMKAFDAHHRRAVAVSVESNQVSAAVLRLIADREERRIGKWEGVASALLGDLNRLVGEEQHARGWPRGANVLTRELNRMTTVLRESGINVTLERRKNGRWVTLERSSN